MEAFQYNVILSASQTSIEGFLSANGLPSRLFLFNTHPLYTLGQSTMTVVAVYKATAKKLEFVSGKSGFTTLF